MRKLFYLLSLLIVASMLLAACGGAAPAEEPAAPAPAEPEAPAPAAEEPAAPAAEEPAMGMMKSKDPATYTKVVFGEPETLDPVLSYETAGGEIVINVYETLVWYDGDKTDVFVPVLAESWDVSADGTVYTFKIRSGVTFHNGNDMTPSDVAYTFQRGLLYGGYSGPQWLLAEPFFGIGTDDVSLLVDPEGNLADDGEALKGADPALLKAACEKVTSAIVADDAAGTVTMTLSQPWGPFIPTMAGTWGSVMDKEWTMENGGWDGSCDTWQNYYAIPSEENPLSEIMNGTGPFMLERWTKGQELVLVRNDNYWREPAKLERIVTQSISEWSTRFAMLQAGDADEVAVPVENRPQVDALVYETCTFNLDSGEYECEVTNPDGFMRVYLGRPGTSRTDIFLNFDIDPNSNYIGSGQLDGNGIPVDFFSDVHVRRAFAYCFDWDIYINDIFNGEAVQSPVLPMYGMPGYDANQEVYTYDPAKCEENFKLADVDKDGIPAGEDPDDVWEVGFRIQALYNQGNTTRQTIGEILGANLAEVNSKFVIETVGVPWPSFLRTFRGGLGPIMSSGWVEDIHDPHNWYVPYMIGTYAYRQNLPDDLRAQFQDAINAGVAATDPAERQAIYEPLNQLYFEQVPTILLAVGTSHAFEQAYVKGVVLNPALFGNYYYPVYKD